MQHFCFLDLSKEKLCSILVFGNVFFNIVVRINHDNVASRGAVGCTHTIVRLQTRIRRKGGTESSGGFVYVLDGFLQRDFVLWVFMCSINFLLFCVSFVCLFSGYHAEGHLYTTGCHALTTTARLSRLCISPGYHAIVYFYSLVINQSYHAPPHT